MNTRSAPMEEILRAVEELRQEFGKGLPAKLDELRDAVEALRRSPADAGACRAVHHVAHRLHGTAGSYGFTRIGSAAGAIERAVAELTGGDGAAVEAWRAIDEALAELHGSTPPSPNARSTPPISSPPMSGPLSAPPLQPRQLPRVLVVDDDPDFLHHIALLARTQLFVASTARTATEALDLAHGQAFDAALIDVHLDESSSFALARDLRAISPALALAFISADGNIARRVEAAHAGATVFLTKPLDAFELAAGLRRLLMERRSDSPRVLLLDDDASFGALIATMLGGVGVDVILETDATQLLDALDRWRPDMLVADVHMPNVGGVDVCRSIRMTQRWQGLPILVVTEDATLATRMAAFEAGADDYLLKPIIAQELTSRVRVRVERARLLHELTNVDPLSRLLSRRGFLDALAPRISDSIRRKLPLALALLDVDHFKSVNDRHGHAAGDRVLAGLGELLASRYRLEDLRCRWGGEEFVVAFPGEDAATIVPVLERTLAELREVEFVADDGTPFRVTFSSGVASLPNDGAALEAILKVADSRLYAAKRGGRARVVGPTG